MAKLRLEEVFVTEGIPQFTFVPPPNFNDILLDVRKPGKPVIIEGQSGTGKTTCVIKAIERLGSDFRVSKWKARKAEDVASIIRLVARPESGIFLIDDFHRLDPGLQASLADMAKLAAEEGSDNPDVPKLILVGINQVGSELISMVPDIAKRVAIHRIKIGLPDDIQQLVERGAELLNVEIPDWQRIYDESAGDYWLTQHLCQTLCSIQNVTETQGELIQLVPDFDKLRGRVIERLSSAYHEGVKQFCRGQRFRPSNDPYFKLLKAIGEQDSSLVDLNELANANADVRGSVNNIKEQRLSDLISAKPECEKLFYYSTQTKNFAIEDPAVFYYIKHLNWDNLRKDCGFRDGIKNFEYDFAISFAGEDRELARCIADNLGILDSSVFFDEYYEVNFLGKALSKQFQSIFSTESRLVICLLDIYYAEKIWPTFERECFMPRVPQEEVIPIFLDDTKFVGISSDLYGIKFDFDATRPDWQETVITDIVYKLIEKLN